MVKQLHIKISGYVQGVFFRAETKAKADRMGIKGWVMNTTDGNVEILAQGESGLLEKFLAWCKKGPERAHVEKVRSEWQPLKKFYADFAIILQRAL